MPEADLPVTIFGAVPDDLPAFLLLSRHGYVVKISYTKRRDVA